MDLAAFAERALERAEDVLVDPFGQALAQLVEAALPVDCGLAQRRRLGLRHVDALDRERVDALRLVDVLQPPLAERMNGDTVGQRRSEERARRLGEEDVPTLPGPAEPG